MSVTSPSRSFPGSHAQGLVILLADLSHLVDSSCKEVWEAECVNLVTLPPKQSLSYYKERMVGYVYYNCLPLISASSCFMLPYDSPAPPFPCPLSPQFPTPQKVTISQESQATQPLPISKQNFCLHGEILKATIYESNEYNCMKTVFILDFLLISHFEHMVLLFS